MKHSEQGQPASYLSPQGLDGRRLDQPQVPLEPTSEELAAFPPPPGPVAPQGFSELKWSQGATMAARPPAYWTKVSLCLLLLALGLSLLFQGFLGSTTARQAANSPLPTASASAGRRALVGDGTFSIGGVLPPGTYSFSVSPRGAGTCTWVTFAGIKGGELSGQTTALVTLTPADGYLSMEGCLLTPQ